MPAQSVDLRIYDFFLSSEGFIYADEEEQKAIYTLTPPFVPRSSIQTSNTGQTGYGDSDTEFFQSFTQKDWSKGEQQKFQGEDEGLSRYWRGENVDVSEEGQVTLRPLTAQTSAFGAAVTETVGRTSANEVFAASAANLYSINSAGTITDHGAHGLGTAPLTMALGGAGKAYLSSTTLGVGVREWDGASFTTFSATGAETLMYLNNALYGLWSSGGVGLIRYDTAGAVTSLYSWQAADGSANNSIGDLATMGGKLLILKAFSVDPVGSELNIYDGVAPTRIAQFGPGFEGRTLAVVNGIAFIGGFFTKRFASGTYRRPAVLYYSNGTVGELWRAETYVPDTGTAEPRVANWNNGLVFTDDTRGVFMFYNPAVGGVSTIGSYTQTNAEVRIAATSHFFLHTRSATQPWRHPSDGTSSSGNVTTSLIDFDSSLNKIFRGITVEWDDDATDTGATVDISYRLNDVNGSYTSLQTGAVSGTEYIPNVTGKSISIRVTLNKSASTFGPALKRIKIRAVPVRQAFRDTTVLLKLSGKDGKRVRLRNGTLHNLSAQEQAVILNATASSGSIVSATDFTGQYSVVIDKLEIIATATGQYLARVRIREV